ncbi:uncharacterized protein LOC135196919 isoform X6 [Macrobrachium nipponense]|uniref:uncharacterized protein LOC135196919 isoform X6 n=1 Tax=Macrobrachium nipponense TaxID=159736 RepID=UPI0030C7CEE2
MGRLLLYCILLLPTITAVSAIWSYLSGELQLEKPIRPARVYASAPSGLYVTSVRIFSDNWYTNYDIRNGTFNTTYLQNYIPRYYLYQSGTTDHKYFSIDEYSGNITTNRYIDRLEGEEYRVLLVALIGGRAINQELPIVVTRYNKYTPRLASDQYTLEVIVTATRGTKLLTIEAFDEDEKDYNRHIQYFLLDPKKYDEIDYFLETPTWSPLDIDPHTGDLKVRYPLDMSKSPLRLLVGASDWGSPQRHVVANLTVYIREMSVCANGTCGHGNCTLHIESPGYTCYCHPGYYGENCQYHNPCLPENPCLHFGRCVNISHGTFRCECPPGFYGPNCTLIDPCSAVSVSPCFNGGTCIRRSHVLRRFGHENKEYRCICPKGFFGEMCEGYDPCSTNPCYYGAWCTNLTNTDFICHCSPGYEGVLCEVDTDECSSAPCSNGATCVDGVASLTCRCSPGYTGTFCEVEIDECSSSPCERGACTDKFNDFVCDCPEGWGGKTCSEDLDECASSPCLNGATCFDGVASFLCDCALGYSGPNCAIAESCPAQTTILNTGEFQWPAVRHGEVAALTCPYGITTAAAKLLAGEPATEMPHTTEASIVSSNSGKSLLQRTILSYEEDEMVATSDHKNERDLFTTVSPPFVDSHHVHSQPTVTPHYSSPSPATVSLQHTSQRPSAVSSQYPSRILPTVSSHASQNRPSVSSQHHFRSHSATQQQRMDHRSSPVHSRHFSFKPTAVQPRHRSHSHHTIHPPITGGYTTHAEWEGGMIHINRRARNADLPLDEKNVDASVSPRTSEREDKLGERRRMISSRIRGTSRKGRPQRRRQQVDSEQIQGREESHMHSDSRGGRQINPQRVQRNHFGLQRQTPVSKRPVKLSGIGEKPAELPRIGEKPVEVPLIGEKLAEYPRIGENPVVHRIGEKPVEHPYTEKTVELPRIGEKPAVLPRIGENLAELTRIGEKPAELHHISEKPAEPPRIGEKFVELPRIGETAIKEKSAPLPQGDNDGQLESLIGEQQFSSALQSAETEQHRTKRIDHSLIKGEIAMHSDSTIGVKHKQDGEKDKYVTRKAPQRLYKTLKTDGMAVRKCVLLPNGSVTWEIPDTKACRDRATLTAENATRDLASLTSSPSSIDAQMFKHAAKQLAKLVEHALIDSTVANSMVSVISNMMEVNDSVLAADEQGNSTNQLVNTINTLTRNVPLDVGETVEFRSNNLVLEARLMKVSDNAVTFRPHLNDDNGDDAIPIDSRKKREANSSAPTPPTEPYLMLPSQVLSMAETENVRLEFASYGNDKFFRGGRSVGMPVLSAKVTDSAISNLSDPVVYYIPTDANVAVFQPSCVYWDEQVRDWVSDGVKTVVTEGVITCEATHLTAFSVLLDPMPAHLGVHEDALSVITYVGLALSTAGLAITVATYAIFRNLNRDRSGKIVMNLSLALLLLNLVFLCATFIEPPSVLCTVFAASLHYLVISAFAWMLVEGTNMYQLLITVFASAETHFMAKRVVAAWGIPVIAVVIALAVDIDVYGDKERNFCVINPAHSPAVYYSTYMGPICLVLLVNCIVFVMVTRVLCQRRPRSKAQSPAGSPRKESAVTLAQVRGAVTVVALLGVTWVAGAFSVGWARLPLQYIFCLTTPLQGLIIFIVRVAQHPEARASWITLLKTGTLRRRPPTTHTHSTHSSGHTHSTTSTAQTPPRNNHSSSRTRSTRASPASSQKTPTSIQTNGSLKHRKLDNGTIKKAVDEQEPKIVENDETDPSMGSIFSRIVKRLSLRNPDPYPRDFFDDAKSRAIKSQENALENDAPIAISSQDYPLHTVQRDSFTKPFKQDSFYQSSGNGTLHRPHSLALLRSGNHEDLSPKPPTSFAEKYFASEIPSLLASNVHPQTLLDAGVPASMIPRRSLGSLLLLTDGKEGDDSSWHFVRPPPDGRSDPVIEMEADPDGHVPPSCEKIVSNDEKKGLSPSETSNSSSCIVLAGQRILTDNSPVIYSGQQQPMFPHSVLTRASSELHMGSPQINAADLRRSSSVFTLGEWEDPRSSQA